MGPLVTVRSSVTIGTAISMAVVASQQGGLKVGAQCADAASEEITTP
ncbi:MAG: hypothetical protein ACO3C1_13005 [Ilumatobacteraceae bacterium]